MYNYISLTKGASTLVDATDVCLLEKLGRWSLSSKGYAVHWTTQNSKRKAIYMHRYIMNAPPDLQVDHINHDRLDNRRDNLRFATRSQNNASRRTLSTNSSGFTGVNRNKTRWEARIRYQGQRIYLGSFPDPQQAAITYDVAASILFGSFANLNCPTEIPSESLLNSVQNRLARRGFKIT